MTTMLVFDASFLPAYIRRGDHACCVDEGDFWETHTTGLLYGATLSFMNGEVWHRTSKGGKPPEVGQVYVVRRFAFLDVDGFCIALEDPRGNWFYYTRHPPPPPRKRRAGCWRWLDVVGIRQAAAT